MASRYGITALDLQQAAMVLQVGRGVQDRINSDSADAFVVLAEDWADDEVATFLAVPLRPIRAQGQSATDFAAAVANATLTRRNFPLAFVMAAIYRGTGLLLLSEFSENAPNTAEIGQEALKLADTYMTKFRSRSTTNVGGGRRRHTNPFMPPNIAPPEAPTEQAPQMPIA